MRVDKRQFEMAVRWPSVRWRRMEIRRGIRKRRDSFNGEFFSYKVRFGFVDVNVIIEFQAHDFGFSENVRMPIRLITIQPWALVVNTTGQSISLNSSTSVLCKLEHMSVVSPPSFDEVNGGH